MPEPWYDTVSQGKASLQQAVLLQFLTKRIAIDSQHVCGLRLIAFRSCHDHFEHRLFDRLHDHVINIGGLLLTQITEVFFEIFGDCFLNIIFAHILFVLKVIG